tara:strand:+ start:261 stop:701 length:441 start_codon:yes stop_codon:yes gene_type:complete
VFQAQDDHEKNKDHQPGSSIGKKNKAILQKRAADDGSETSTSAAAGAVIEQIQIQQQLDDLRDEICRKFPAKPGEKNTWDKILDEREKRIAAKAEREKQEKIDAEERAERRRYMLIQLAQGVAVLVVIAGISAFLYWAATAGPAVR